jgi:V8-like Glu-specific endopeptidase
MGFTRRRRVLGLEKTYSVQELFFTSPFKKFDVTILRFDKQDEKEIRKKLTAKNVPLFTLSNRNLQKDGNERIYIIGHPAGGTLQLSLQDNALLDFEGRLLHYRTPTVGGSSGSPVFDSDWNLVGIHHAGGNYIRKLNNERGMYQANEGIRISSIIEELKKK